MNDNQDKTRYVEIIDDTIIFHNRPVATLMPPERCGYAILDQFVLTLRGVECITAANALDDAYKRGYKAALHQLSLTGEQQHGKESNSNKGEKDPRDKGRSERYPDTR